MEVGEEGDYVPIATRLSPPDDCCIKMGSDENHFHNCEGQSHKTVSSQTTTSEENGQPKQIRTQVLLLTA